MDDDGVGAALEPLLGLHALHAGARARGRIDRRQRRRRGHDDRAVPAAPEPQSRRDRRRRSSGRCAIISASRTCCGWARAWRATTPTATSTTSPASSRRRPSSRSSRTIRRRQPRAAAGQPPPAPARARPERRPSTSSRCRCPARCSPKASRCRRATRTSTSPTGSCCCRSTVTSTIARAAESLSAPVSHAPRRPDRLRAAGVGHGRDPLRHAATAARLAWCRLLLATTFRPPPGGVSCPLSIPGTRRRAKRAIVPSQQFQLNNIEGGRGCPSLLAGSAWAAAAGRAFRVLLAGFAIAIGVRGVVNWPIAAMAAPQDARQEDERATLAKDKAAVKDREQTVARRERTSPRSRRPPTPTWSARSRKRTRSPRTVRGWNRNGLASTARLARTASASAAPRCSTTAV